MPRFFGAFFVKLDALHCEAGDGHDECEAGDDHDEFRHTTATTFVTSLLAEEHRNQLLGGYGANGHGSATATARTEASMETAMRTVTAMSQDPRYSGRIGAEFDKFVKDDDPKLADLSVVVPPPRPSPFSSTAMDEVNASASAPTRANVAEWDKITLELIYNEHLSGKIVVQNSGGILKVFMVVGYQAGPVRVRNSSEVHHGVLLLLRLGNLDNVLKKLDDARKTNTLQAVTGFLNGKQKRGVRYPGQPAPTISDLRPPMSRIQMCSGLSELSGRQGKYEYERAFFEIHEGEVFSPEDLQELEVVSWLSGQRRNAVAEQREAARKAQAKAARAATTAAKMAKAAGAGAGAGARAAGQKKKQRSPCKPGANESLMSLWAKKGNGRSKGS